MRHEVVVRQYDVEGITLKQWPFNNEINDYAREISNAGKGRWLKLNNYEWIYWCDWSCIESLCNVFMQNDYDVTNLFDIITDYKYNPASLPLKQLQPIRFYSKNGGWITIRFISITSIDYSSFKPTSYRQFCSDDGEWILAIPVRLLNPWIEFFAKEHFDIMPLIAVRDDILSGKYEIDSEKQPHDKKEKKSMPKKYPPDVTEIQRELSDLQFLDVTKLDLPFEPHRFQLEDARKMLKLKRQINASDMGLGKTFESILVGESIPMAKLVVCPASLRLNWKREILQVNPDANISIIYSDQRAKQGKGWTIIGYPSLTKYKKWLMERNFQVVFFDEAHYVKAVTNSGKPDSQRAKVAMEIAEQAEYCYPITGTPKANRNRDLFNILRLVKHPLAKTERDFWQFGQRYCNAYRDQFGWHMQGNSNDRELHEQIKDFMIRRLKKDELPGLTKQRILIPVEADLKSYRVAYDQYAQIKSYQVDEEDKAAMGALQVARQSLAIAKVPQSIDFAKTILERDEQVVVVTCFRGVVDEFQREFGDKCVTIVGGQTDAKKQQAIDDFQSGKVPVLVMNVIAGGVGITLTKAHTMIINDMDWVIGNVTQAEDRICRTGQNEHCIIYYMIAEDAEIDKILRKSLTRKSETLNKAIDGGRGADVKLIDDEEF